MGEYEIFIWIAYGVTGLVMFWLLWRTVKELHDAETSIATLQDLPGASFASARYLQTASSVKTPVTRAAKQN